MLPCALRDPAWPSHFYFAALPVAVARREGHLIGLNNAANSAVIDTRL
jgi:hypothetical protein